MEKRILPQELSDVRAVKGEDGIYHIPGKGIVFNQRSQKLGWFYEIIDPRALDSADISDVVASFNHNMDYTLGRTSNRTVSLSISSTDVEYDIIPPDNQTIRDIVIAPIIRRDVTGSSFMFATAHKGDEWQEEENGVIVRYVRKIEKVYEMGPVTLPAYTSTTTDYEKRSFDDFIKEIKRDEIHFRSEWAKRQMSLLK